MFHCKTDENKTTNNVVFGTRTSSSSLFVDVVVVVVLGTRTSSSSLFVDVVDVDVSDHNPQICSLLFRVSPSKGGAQRCRHFYGDVYIERVTPVTINDGVYRQRRSCEGGKGTPRTKSFFVLTLLFSQGRCKRCRT